MRAHRRLIVRFCLPATALAASAIYMGLPNDSSACMCVCWGSPQEELAAYDLVFHGRMIDSHETIGCGRKDAIFTFEVLGGYRGAETGDHVELFARDESCGAADAYAIGDEVVVFTDTANPWLSRCHPHVRAPEGHYNACSTATDDPDVTFDDVVAALEAASD